MISESMSEQEQLHIKDNENKTFENVDKRVEVASACAQMSTDTHDNEVSCKPKPVPMDHEYFDKQTTAGTDNCDSLRSNQTIEFSNDYLTQMMISLHQRDIALYESSFLDSDVKGRLQVCSNEANREASTVQEPLNANVSVKAIRDEEIDKAVLIVENKVDVPIEEIIGKNKTNRQVLIVDKSNSSEDITEIEKESSIKNTKKSDSERIPVDKLENVNSTKGISRNKLKGMTDVEADTVIDRLQNMDWLKPAGVDNTEINRRKFSQKSSVEQEEFNEDIKEEFTEKTKTSCKSSKKRQSRHRKTRAGDSFKLGSTKDDNDSAAKNEVSKASINAQTGESSKDPRAMQLTGPQKIFIGRGRNDRFKVSLCSLQPRGSCDVIEQRNKTRGSCNALPATVERKFGKSEGSSDKVDKVKDFSENIAAAADSNQSKQQDVREAENSSRDLESSCNQPSVSNSSIQKNEDKISARREQELPAEEQQDSKNTSTNTNLSSRPIYGRFIDKSSSEMMPAFVKGFGLNADKTILENNNKQPLQSQNLSNLNRFPEQISRNQSYSKYEGKINQSFVGKEKSCTFDQGLPRWNHNNYPDKQNVTSKETNASNKAYTSNKHRAIDNEEKWKNQVVADRTQGSKRYSDKRPERTSAGRCFDGNQDNYGFPNQLSDKNQDYRNYAEYKSNRNRDNKPYHDLDCNRHQSYSRFDRYVDKNPSNRGFDGNESSDVNQVKPCDEKSFNKFRDSKNCEGFCGTRKRSENQGNSNTVGADLRARYPCPRNQQQAVDNCLNNNLMNSGQEEDYNKEKQNEKSDAKSQKHYDNTKQASSLRDISSCSLSVDQNVELLGTLNQSAPYSQVNAKSTAAFTSSSVCTNENVTKFFQSLGPAMVNSQNTLGYVNSKMNANAPPFEVAKPAAQETNNQQMYASTHGKERFISLDNNCAIDVVRMNEISNNSEEYLKLHQEISELSKTLALKQSQLLALQIKLFKAASAADKTRSSVVNQQDSPAIQAIDKHRMAQEQNPALLPNYMQMNNPNNSLNLQTTQSMYGILMNPTAVDNCVTEPNINVQPVYLAQGDMYQ